MDQEIRLTSRGKYAVMAMIELARTHGQPPKPLAEIAKQADISLSYLEQLIAGLRRRGLVKSYRGPGGGYMLARHPSEIHICDILEAAEDSTPARRTSRSQADIRAANCAHTQYLWVFMGKILHAALAPVSLSDLMEFQIKSSVVGGKLIEMAGRPAL